MLLRRLTQHVVSQNWVAVGLDFIIVVAGILIAFQITNWNEARQERNALESYLTSMSRNISSDLNKVATLKEERLELITRIQILSWNPLEDDFIDRSRISLASESLGILSEYEYFRSDSSGFETLKGAGFLRHLQGRELESLIFDYYILADEIARKEEDYNEILKSYVSDFSRQNFEGLIYFLYPDYIASDAELSALQPSIQAILRHPTLSAIHSHAIDRTPELIVRYDNLQVIGHEILRLIDSGNYGFENTSTSILAALYDLDSSIGYPDIVRNGTTFSRFYEFGHAASNDGSTRILYGSEDLILHFPESDWAVFYLRNRSSYLHERPAKDFSKYHTLKLEIRGHAGGESLWVSLKDSRDPDDGTESRFALTLTKDWTTYDIPLDYFETADLKTIFLPLSLITDGGPHSVSIRNVQYVR